MNTISKIFFFSLLLYSLQTLFTQESNAQLVSDFMVNEDSTNYSHYGAKIGSDTFGNFVVVWYDSRTKKNPRICGQIFNSNAQRIGDQFQINNDKYQALPSLSVRKNGSFGVSWSVIQTKFRIFDVTGVPISNEIIVGDSSGSVSSCGADTFGNFVVAWEQYNSSLKRNIYCRIIDSTGNIISDRIRVNDDNLNIDHIDPAISVRQDGSFIVTWSDIRPPSMIDADDIYLQIFDKFGNRIGANKRVNDDTNIFNRQISPRTSCDMTGQFVVAWEDSRLDEDNTEIYAQSYFDNGSKIGTNFRVTQSPTFVPKGLSSVKMRNDGSFIIYWSEFHNFIGQPYFQRFNNEGFFIGNNFLVTPYFPDFEKFSSDIEIFNNRIISIWADARNSSLDIYCNVRSFSNPDTTVNVISISTIIPERFELYQNYPNPFNPHTKIKFEISKSGAVEINVYDINGRSIKTLVNEMLAAGSYEVLFNSTELNSSLSSGIYFYELVFEKEIVATKKMILIK